MPPRPGENPTAQVKRVTFQVDDGGLVPSGGLSSPVSKFVTMTPVNDPPILTGDTTALELVGQELSLQPTLSISDTDGDGVTRSAQVRIVSGCDPAADTLVLVGAEPPLGVTRTYTASTCTLQLTGSAPYAEYEVALRAVRLVVTGESTQITKTITFTVNDFQVSSDPLARSVFATGNLPRPRIDTVRPP